MDAKQRAEKEAEQALDDLTKAIVEHEAKGGDPAEFLDHLHQITDQFSDESKAQITLNAVSSVQAEHREEVAEAALDSLSDEQLKQLLARYTQQSDSSSPPPSN